MKTGFSRPKTTAKYAFYFQDGHGVLQSFYDMEKRHQGQYPHVTKCMCFPVLPQFAFCCSRPSSCCQVPPSCCLQLPSRASLHVFFGCRSCCLPPTACNTTQTITKEGIWHLYLVDGDCFSKINKWPFTSETTGANASHWAERNHFFRVWGFSHSRFANFGTISLAISRLKLD